MNIKVAKRHGLPRVIQQHQAERWLGVLEKELQRTPKPKKQPIKIPWYGRKVWLEYPLGELVRNVALTLMLTDFGSVKPKTMEIEGNERFNAQGLEGKASSRMPFARALHILKRLPAFRGRIVVWASKAKGGKQPKAPSSRRGSKSTSKG
jgi:hypothetical protein